MGGEIRFFDRSGVDNFLKGRSMFKWLDNIPFALLLVLSVFLGLAPYKPEPHLVEKIRMLLHAQPVKPVDIFDLGEGKILYIKVLPDAKGKPPKHTFLEEGYQEALNRINNREQQSH